jgi:hypothetical protein
MKTPNTIQPILVVLQLRTAAVDEAYRKRGPAITGAGELQSCAGEPDRARFLSKAAEALSTTPSKGVTFVG